jgi:hypothetical protein
MSYIDTFDHEFVGYLAGVPIYHPLEVVPASEADAREFGCDPGCLVIGDGPGWHAAIVCRQLDDMVRHFVRGWAVWQHTFDVEVIPAEVRVLPAWQAALAVPAEIPDSLLEFAGWSADQLAEFRERCSSSGQPRPFSPARDDSLASWLVGTIGEFVLLAMPDLAPLAAREFAELRVPIQNAMRPETNYENILLAPPGYRPWGRREADGTLHWGAPAWQTQRVQYPLTSRQQTGKGR